MKFAGYMTWVAVLAVTVLLCRAAGAAQETGVAGAGAGADVVPVRVEDIINYREYSESFASSGQPSRGEFQAIADAGFRRVVYIAFTDNPGAVADEDLVVKGLGMEYMHIPVDFDAPLPADFYAFADSLNRDPDKKTLLHCQVNYRATVFSFLYRVIYRGVSVEAAKADMNSVWQPNEIWRDFIFDVLAEHAIDPHCPGCDWTPPELRH